MASSQHYRSNESHRVWTWEYADATARGAATGFVNAAAPSGDIGRWAKQLDTGVLWEVASVNGDTTANWTQVNGIISGPTGVNLQDYTGAALGTATTLRAYLGEVQFTSAGGGVWNVRGGYLANTVVPPSATVADMPAALLVAQRAGTGCFLTTLSAGTTVGGTIGSVIDSTVENSTMTNAVNFRMGDAVKYADTVYAIHTYGSGTDHKVVKRNSDGTWTIVRTKTQTSNAWQRSGLFIATRGSAQRLGFVFGNSTNQNISYQYTDDGSTWAEITWGSGTNVNLIRNATMCLDRGMLYFVADDNAANPRLQVLDCFGLSASSFSISGNQNINSASICTMNGRIFMYSPAWAPGYLFEWNGAGFTALSQSVPHNFMPTASNLTGCSPLLFVIQNNQLGLFYATSYNNAGTNYYWRFCVFNFASSTDTAPTVASYDSVVPTAYQQANASSSFNVLGVFANVDNMTDPGNPQTYTYWMPSISGTLLYGKYKGTGTTITTSTTGAVASSYSWPFGKQGGGERFAAMDSNEVYPSAGYPTLVNSSTYGRVVLTGKITCPNNTSKTFTAKAWISTPEVPQGAQIVMVGSATGATRSGNTLTGIAHNTVFSVELDLLATGVTPNANAWWWISYVMEP